MFKHHHEESSGRTSSIGQHTLCLDAHGNILNDSQFRCAISSFCYCTVCLVLLNHKVPKWLFALFCRPQAFAEPCQATVILLQLLLICNIGIAFGPSTMAPSYASRLLQAFKALRFLWSKGSYSMQDRSLSSVYTNGQNCFKVR
jgi:hypothetical protein